MAAILRRDTTGPRTGWPPGLLQDDNGLLFRWFASRMDARYIVRVMFGDYRR
jgi:hypothetical protein